MRPALLFIVFVALLFFMTLGLKAQTNVTVNNGETVTINQPSTLGCIYTWTNDNPAIGLAASGNGDVGSFTAVNNGKVPVTATITLKPTHMGYAFTLNYSQVDLLGIPYKSFYSLNLYDIQSSSIVPNGANGYFNRPTPVYLNIGDPREIFISPDNNKLYLFFANSVTEINNTSYAVTKSTRFLLIYKT